MLQEQNVVLRPVSHNDLDEIMTWINDQEVNQYIVRVLPVTREMESAWITSLTNNNTKVIFGICYQESDTEKLIGTCGLHNINWIDRSAITGVAIGNKDYWQKKVGSISFHLLLTYAFINLNLHRISSSALAFNARSIAMHKRLGFKEEGRERKGVFRHGTYHDIINFGLLRHEFVHVEK